MTRISIDPITRLEGHGKIEIFLDDQGKSRTVTFRCQSCEASRRSASGAPPRRCRV